MRNKVSKRNIKKYIWIVRRILEIYWGKEEYEEYKKQKEYEEYKKRDENEYDKQEEYEEEVKLE